MPRSMTGYGAARAAGRRVAAEAEARSVNARSLKVSLRTPPALGPHESDIEGLVRAHCRRGTVNVSVRLTLVDPVGAVRLHPEVIAALALQLEPLRRKGLVTGTLTADAVAAIPGAIEATAEEPLGPADWKVVREAIEGALAAMDAMRRREGARLGRELKGVLKRLSSTVTAIIRRAPAVAAEQQARLRDRINALLQGTGASLDEATLAREVAVLADRSDVTEEIARLQAHIAEFASCLGKEEEIGRTLDFLSQEMLREANTIGSKSADVELARAVISLKSDIDRLKEQVANFE